MCNDEYMFDEKGEPTGPLKGLIWASGALDELGRLGFIEGDFIGLSEKMIGKWDQIDAGRMAEPIEGALSAASYILRNEGSVWITNPSVREHLHQRGMTDLDTVMSMLETFYHDREVMLAVFKGVVGTSDA